MGALPADGYQDPDDQASDRRFGTSRQAWHLERKLWGRQRIRMTGIGTIRKLDRIDVEELDQNHEATGVIPSRALK
jgi:hypothetical protein